VIASRSKNSHVCGCASIGIYLNAEKTGSLMMTLTIGVRVFCSNCFDAISEIPWWAMIAIFASCVPNASDINSRVWIRGTSGLRKERHRARGYARCDDHKTREVQRHLTRRS
jgi:hypothetical protein